MGTFVVLHWHPCLERSWRDVLCLKYDLPGQASLTACLLWPMYFSHVWPKTLQLLLDGQDDEQIYIIFFLIYKPQTKKLKSWTFTKWVGGTKDKQETKLNNSWAVVMMATRSVFLLIPGLFFLHVFPCQLDRETGMDNTSLPSCLKCGVTE